MPLDDPITMDMMTETSKEMDFTHMFHTLNRCCRGTKIIHKRPEEVLHNHTPLVDMLSDEEMKGLGGICMLSKFNISN